MSLAAPATWLESLASAGGLLELGWVVLHSLWQGVAVAALLAVALRFVPRRSAYGQEARYLLATLALFSLPVACGVTWALVEPPRTASAWEASRVKPYAFTFNIGLDSPASAAGRTAAGPTAAETLAVLATHAATAAEPWLPLCGSLWLAGAIAAAGRLAVSWSLTRRLVATAAEVPDARWQARLTRWQSALGVAAPIRLLTSARIDVPIVVGWLRPVVIWPAAAVFGMPPEQIDAILAHELAHVRRHDVLVNFLQSVIEAVFFHHPAAWWISAQVRAEREHCADELAIRALATGQAGSRISYAMALLSLEERRQAILAAAANGGSLGDRIRRLAGIEQQTGHPARLAAAVVVLVAVAATLATSSAGNTRRAVAAEAKSTVQAAQTLTATATATDLPADTNQIEAPTPDGEGEFVRNVQTPADTNAIDNLKPDGEEERHAQTTADTNALESLTPEQARTLAEEFPGLEFTKDNKHGSWSGGGCLPLNSLKTLDPATARALAGWRGCLLLDGLTMLDAETAKPLADFRGHVLSLDGLTTLDADAAKAVATGGRELSLNGLTTLDADTTRAIAAVESHLFLNGLTRLDADTAKALAASKGHLWLNGVTTLDAETAEALAAFSGPFLWLDGLTTIDADTARALAEFQGSFLSLQGLTSLEADAARALARFRGERILVTTKIEKMICPHDPLTPGNPLTPETALTFNNSVLSRLTAMESPDSVAIAKALATRKRPLALPNLRRISPKTLAALLEKSDIEIPPIETLELIQEPDGSLTEDFVIPEGLEARQTAARE